MSIDKEAVQPLYLQLAALLRAQIAAGDIRSLPSIAKLAEQHDVAEVTVKKAIDLLKQEGLIETWPGRGTFVK